MDSFDFKGPGAQVDVTVEDETTFVDLDAIWGSGGVAIDLEAIWGSGGVALLDGQVDTLGQDTIELFDAVG